MPIIDQLELYQNLPDRPFARADVLRDGVSRRGIERLVDEGRLLQPVRGILVKARVEDDVASRASALCRVIPDGAAVCRGTAAWLFGVDARPLGGQLEPPRLECSVPIGQTPLRRPDIACYTTDLVDGDVVDVDGLACVSPNRTAIDLARWCKPGIGLGVLDAMARQELIDPRELLELVERWRGGRYIARARRLIELCDPRSESVGESGMRLRFCDAGFPVPELQISLRDESGRERRRLDMGYLEYRYAWEYDGMQYHRGPEQETADRLRRKEITSRWGWTVLGIEKNLVWGPSMMLEWAVAEVIGLEPQIRHRSW